MFVATVTKMQEISCERPLRPQTIWSILVKHIVHLIQFSIVPPITQQCNPLQILCNVDLKLPEPGNFYVNMVIMSNGYVDMGSLFHIPTLNCL